DSLVFFISSLTSFAEDFTVPEFSFKEFVSALPDCGAFITDKDAPPTTPTVNPIKKFLTPIICHFLIYLIECLPKSTRLYAFSLDLISSASVCRSSFEHSVSTHL